MPKCSPTISCSRRRVAWQSSPGRTSTCAASAGNPEVTSQTWRSWTSTTPGWAASALPTAAGSTPWGAASSSTRPEAHSNRHPEASMSTATSSEAIGSARSKPVTRITAPAAAASSDDHRSVSTCARAPSMFRLRRSARESVHAFATFTPAPASPTARTNAPSTSDGFERRAIASTAMTPARTSSAPPLTWAERISARPSPNVNRPRAGRAASRAATSASAIAPASVSMCAASESSASDEARTPATTSTTMNASTVASAIASQRRSAAGETPWWW